MFWNVTSRLYWKELSTTGRGLVGAGFPYCKVCTPGTLRSSSKKFKKSCSSVSEIFSFNQKYTLCKMVPFAIVLGFAPSSSEEVHDVSTVPVKPAAVTDFKKFLLSILMVFVMKIQTFPKFALWRKRNRRFWSSMTMALPPQVSRCC